MRLTPAQVMNEVLGTFRNGHFTVDCSGCKSMDEVPIRRVIARHGAQYSIVEAVELLTCRGGGGKPTEVGLASQDPFQRVRLIPPGPG
jgi:hypothetical protein